MLDLEDVTEAVNEIELLVKGGISESDVGVVQLEDRITWNIPLITEPIARGVTRFGCIIKPPERLTYAPAVELQHLGKMAE